jgi:FkbM family methyltransferase
MTNIEFSIVSSETPEKIKDILTDDENLDKFFPPLVKTDVTKNSDTIILDQAIQVRNKVIRMKSDLQLVKEDEFLLTITSGPLTNSITRINLTKKPEGTVINVQSTLKVNFLYKIFSTMIERKYKNLISIFINKINDAAILTTGETWKAYVSTNTLKLSKQIVKQSPTFHGWWYGDLKHMFLEKDYQILDVQNRLVVDVGANIGDSSIYFALNNAKKIIAIEAFPINFQMLQKNIHYNMLSGKIIPLSAALSGKNSILTVNADISHGYTSFKLKQQKLGVQIETITLKDVVKKFDINDAVLKLDCEGCEYDVILGSDKDTLLKFQTILIEFHNGYENIQNKLEEFGFKIIKLVPLNPTKGYLLVEKINQQI